MIMAEFYYHVCQWGAVQRYLFTISLIDAISACWWHWAYEPLKAQIVVAQQRIHTLHEQHDKNYENLAAIREAESRIERVQYDIKQLPVVSAHKVIDVLMRAIGDAKMVVMHYALNTDSARRLFTLTLHTRGTFCAIMQFMEQFPYGVSLQLESAEFVQHANQDIDGVYSFSFYAGGE